MHAYEIAIELAMRYLTVYLHCWLRIVFVVKTPEQSNKFRQIEILHLQIYTIHNTLTHTHRVKE